MHAPEPLAAESAPVLLGCFEVGESTVAIEVSQLREIVRYRAATPLPGAPASIDGVIELRGALIPVVDLGHLLGGERLRAGPRARIAVAVVEGIAIGLAVDGASRILSVPGDALGAPPALALRSGGAATRAVVRSPDGPPIALLSLEHVVERLYREALADPEAAR